MTSNDVIVNEDYSPGVPGRACLSCRSAWPATEPDDEPWHHAAGCEDDPEAER